VAEIEHARDFATIVSVQNLYNLTTGAPIRRWNTASGRAWRLPRHAEAHLADGSYSERIHARRDVPSLAG
jgi:hypothetical protein